MIRKLIRRWLMPKRNASGQFVGDRHKVIQKAAEMRAMFPGKEWKHTL